MSPVALGPQEEEERPMGEVHEAPEGSKARVPKGGGGAHGDAHGGGSKGRFHRGCRRDLWGHHRSTPDCPRVLGEAKLSEGAPALGEVSVA